MKNTTFYTDRKRSLIRIYHSVCSLNGMKEDDKKSLLAGYNVESSLDLTEVQLMQIIEKLQQEPNMWRRRVMAAIGAWLRSVNKNDTAELIKGIACRSCSCTNFNQIPVSQLRNVYYEFVRKEKTAVSVQSIMKDELAKLELCN